MALSLQLTGIATNLVMCVAVEGGVIKEYVSTDVDSNKTLGTGVAGGVSNSSTWKGVVREAWASTANTSFDFNGIKFASGHRPSQNLLGASGWSLFEAYVGMNGTGGGDSGIISFSHTSDSGDAGIQRSGTSKLQLRMSAGARGQGTTSLPTDNTTKFSAGITYINAGSVGAVFYYGLESGSLAADGTSAAGIGWEPGTALVYGIGGFEGAGEQPATRHVSCLFNRVLTLTEMQSLHNDWYGTLFTGGAGAGVSEPPRRAFPFSILQH